MSRRELKPGEIRKVSDDIRDQHQKMKDMPIKDRLSYFWLYYKVHTFVVIGVVAFIVSMIVNFVTAKDYGFYGVMLNASLLDNTSMQDSFIEFGDLDAEHFDYFIETDTTLSYHNTSSIDMTNAQRLIALTQTKDLDAVVFDSEIFGNFSFNEMFMDLRTVLSPEDLEKYEPYFYYVDYAEIAATENSDEVHYNSEDYETESGEIDREAVIAETDTHRHPENMKEPVPVGIFMEESPFATKSNVYSPLIPVYGIAVTSQRVDTAIEYLHFLWDDTIDFSQMYVAF